MLSKHLSGNFLDDVTKGQIAEREVQQVLSETFKEFEIIQADNDTPEFDFIAKVNGKETSYEVKEDYKASETGFVAVEIKTRNKPTGVYKIKADYIVYKLHLEDGSTKFIMYRTSALKRRCLTGDYSRRVEGAGRGNVQTVILFEIDDFCDNGMILWEAKKY